MGNKEINNKKFKLIIKFKDLILKKLDWRVLKLSAKILNGTHVKNKKVTKINKILTNSNIFF